nr:MAG TPA: hypothetical protein [Caudoviricetes sp.]
MTDKIPAEITIFFRNNGSLTFKANKIVESANAFHFGKIIVPFAFIKDTVVKDPDNLLGLTG